MTCMPLPAAASDAILDTYPALPGLLALWRGLAAGRRIPTRGSLDLEQLKPWLGHLLLLDALGDGRFRYRVYGSAVAALYGHDLQGRAVDALPPSARAALLADYERAQTGRE